MVVMMSCAFRRVTSRDMRRKGDILMNILSNAALHRELKQCKGWHPSISMFRNVSICSPASLDWFTVSILCPCPCFIGLKLTNMTGNGLEETLSENHLAPFNALERDLAMMSFSHFSDFSVLANQHQTRTSLDRMSMWKLMGTNVY